MKHEVELRAHYIGAVSLLCRVYAALEPEAKAIFAEEGSLERMAADFNSHSFSLGIEKAGNGWGVFAKTQTEERHD